MLSKGWFMASEDFQAGAKGAQTIVDKAAAGDMLAALQKVAGEVQCNLGLHFHREIDNGQCSVFVPKNNKNPDAKGL
jgi:hypothetical protein